MDTERLAEFVSTLVIVGGIMYVTVGSAGVEDLQTRLLYTAAVTLVPFAPLVYLLVYRFDLESHMIGPWGPEDIVFLAAVAPGLFAVVWIADAFFAGSPLYWVVVAPGIVAAILLAVVVRSLTVGEWPPGSAARSESGGGGPPGTS